VSYSTTGETPQASSCRITHTQWMFALTLRGQSLLWTEWRARCGYTPTHWMFALTSRGPSLLWTEWRTRCGYTHTHWMFVLTSKGQSLLWTEWRARLSLPGGERIGSSWWPWRDTGVLVVSWLVCWLRVVALRCGRFSLVHRLSSVAGSLTWCSGMSASYTLPASRTRPNAAQRCYSPRWLARRQDCWRLALRVKLLCGRFPHS
jgi:hypothetical protein